MRLFSTVACLVASGLAAQGPPLVTSGMPGAGSAPLLPLKAVSMAPKTLAALQRGLDATNQESPFTGPELGWMREYVAPTAPAGAPPGPEGLAHLPEMEPAAAAPRPEAEAAPPLAGAGAPPAPQGDPLRCFGGTVVDPSAYLKCTHIEGGLFIRNTQLPSLDVFVNVESVQTHAKTPQGVSGTPSPAPVVISNNPELASLAGLSALRGKVESLVVEGNPKLTSLHGLNGITGADHVTVASNAALGTVDALASLTGTVKSGIVVHANARLSSLHGLSGLKAAGAAPTGVCLQISGNDAITSLYGLSSLATCGKGAIVLANNTALEDLSQLSAVSTIGVDSRGVSLEVDGNSALTTLGPALQKITEFPGAVRILRNAGLERAGALLRSLRSAGGITISDCPTLELSAALRQLRQIRGGIKVQKTGATTLRLDSLVSVGKAGTSASIVIRGNSRLATVDIPSLTASPSALVLSRNAALRTCTLRKLASLGADGVGVSLVVNDNDALTELGLPVLHTCTGGIAITSNSALVHGRLDALKSIGKSTTTGNSIELENNDKLKSMGLALEALQGALKVVDNKVLAELPRVGTVGRNVLGQSLVISRNPGLTTLSPLSGLSGAVSGSIVVSHNEALELLLGLDSITTVGKDVSANSLVVTHNAVLKSLEGLRACSTLEGALVIQSNEGLRSLNGLQRLDTIRGKNLLGDSLHIYGNPKLRDLHGIHNLHGALAGAISIDSNAGLVSVHGLEGVNAIASANTFGNAVQIINNDRITDILGLGGLAGKLGGAITISNNKQLTTLEGLCNVRAVQGKDLAGRSISISSNPSLRDIRCLAFLGGRLDGGINIDANPKLGSVKELKGKNPITKVGGDISINLVHCLTADDAAFLKSLCKQSSTCHTNVQRATRCTSKPSGNSLVGVGTGRKCGGVSSIKWHQWQHAGSSGLYIDVDTTSCNFAITPAYVSSIIGDAAHWQLVGVNSIYSATKSGFRVYLWHPVLRGAYLRFFATRYNWRVSWMADTGRSAGITRAGKTGWKQFAKDTVYTDVDTRACQFASAPRLVASLHGKADHWRTQGVHALYSKTATGFRVYVSHISAKALLAAQAEKNEWAVSWVGSEDDRYSGLSDHTHWKAFCASRTHECAPVSTYFAVYVDVDTSSHQFRTNKVSYVTSVSGAGNHLAITGAASLYRPSNTGFRLYLDRAPRPADVIKAEWRVNYIAYEGVVDCSLSVWSTWSACSQHCGIGTRTRTRKVVVAANAFGTCGALSQQEFCNQRQCDADCTVSAWGQWNRCSRTCGSGLQTRERAVARAQKPGGKLCPPLSQTQYCSAGRCPVHCHVSQWSDWSSCTRSCGSGTRVRGRVTLTPASTKGRQCPALREEQACGSLPCPVHCTMSAWVPQACTSKSRCPDTGVQVWRRKVHVQGRDGGVPCGETTRTTLCGGTSCPGSCPMPHEYGKWSECSQTCGGGYQMAAHPAPGTVRKGCPKHLFRACGSGACPVDCQVGHWGRWSGCSKTCGKGVMMRSRFVAVPLHGGAACPSATQQSSCMALPCPESCTVSEWSKWTACTRSCGGGVQTAKRTVVSHARSGGYECPELTMSRRCGTQPCPVDCVMAPWGAWTDCSHSCGHGSKTRSRKMISGAAGGRSCPNRHEVAQCNTQVCPSSCTLKPWGAWSACSKTCGFGELTRHRTIVTGQVHGGKCPPVTQTKPCASPCCPGTAGVPGACKKCPAGTYQNEHGQLTCKPCGGGTYNTYAGSTRCYGCTQGTKSTSQAQGLDNFKHCVKCPAGRVSLQDGSRECVHCKSGKFSASAGNWYCRACPAGKFTNHLAGQTQCYNIPRPCVVSRWGSWSTCSKSCGAGTRIRRREITTTPLHGAPACPVLAQIGVCNGAVCKIDCAYTAWGAWRACTKTCGTGTQRRQRGVLAPPLYGGKPCTSLAEDRACAVAPCPVDCTLGPIVWSQCSSTCGTGKKLSSRSIVRPASYGGRACSAYKSQTVACTAARPCSTECAVSSWSTWSKCTKSCGGGSRTRKRTVRSRGTLACPALQQIGTCNDAECSVDCAHQSWGAWTACTKTCSGGVQQRSRMVMRNARGNGKACGSSAEQRTCNASACPVDCIEGKALTQWTECSKSCGTGQRARRRVGDVPARNGGKHCSHAVQTEMCGTEVCPRDCRVGSWSLWSACTSTCGGGGQKRTRKLVQPQFGGKLCPSAVQRRACNDHLCPVDCVVGAFTQWSVCSKSCGSGTQARTRVLTAAQHGGKRCPARRETRSCTHGACPVHCAVSSFSPWSQCTALCGKSGVQQRTRVVTRHSANGGYVCPYLAESRSCNVQRCPFEATVTAPLKLSCQSVNTFGVCASLRGNKLRALSRAVATAVGVPPTDAAITSCKKGVATVKLAVRETFVRSHAAKPLPGGLLTSLFDAVDTAELDANTVVRTLTNRYASAAQSALRLPTFQASLASKWADAYRQVVGDQAAESQTKAAVARAEAQAKAKGRTLDSLQRAAAALAAKPAAEAARRSVQEAQSTRVAALALQKTCTPSASASSISATFAPEAPLVGVEHCDFTLWSEWTTCSKKCGGGSSTQKRTIVSTPLHGGRSCPTELVRTRPCNVDACDEDCIQVDENAWSPCTKSCGIGRRSKTRRIVRAAKFNGKPCRPSRVIEFCSTHPCPVDCAVSHFTAWSACSKTCGFGLRKRTRVVTRVSLNGGHACPHIEEKMECDSGKCPYRCKVGAFSAWSKCTKTCGTGQKQRTRSVTELAPDSVCPLRVEVVQCNAMPCPVQCRLSPWSAWEECNKPCGGGTQTRSRDILTQPANGASACPQRSETRSCNAKACPIDCVVSPWGAWSNCPVSCGKGVHSRVRRTVLNAKHGGRACPSFSEIQSCNAQACPVDCKLRPWGKWSACSRTCGTGHQLRSRTIAAAPKFGGTKCAHTVDLRECAHEACSVSCVLAKWGAWQPCSATCGAGTRSRQRAVAREAQHGGAACGARAQMEACKMPACPVRPGAPVNCATGRWTAWGSCTATCGRGVRVRSRAVNVAPLNGGTPCGKLSQIESCNTKPCPTNCVVSRFTLGACSVTCGAGTMTHTRGIDVAPAFGGTRCPPLTLTQTCNAGPCAVDCSVSAFGEWSPCTRTCGGGTQYRTRHVRTRALHGGITCPDLREARACGSLPCPVDCEVGAWQAWSTCTRSCGAGRQWRVRTVKRSRQAGGAQCAHTSEVRACAAHACPRDCHMGPWKYGPCSATCGAGLVLRTRAVARPAGFGGVPCGVTKDAMGCNDGPCPIHCKVNAFLPWGPCTKSCGTGSQSRSRSIYMMARHGGDVCPFLTETRDCNQESCPVDCAVASWGAWSACSASCGGGAQKRKRLRVGTWAKFGGKPCPSREVSRVCNAHKCPVPCVLGKWQQWTPCSRTCNGGSQRRTRAVVQAAAHGGDVCFHRQETRRCGSGPCPLNCDVSPWGQWGQCSQTCGTGSQTRTRNIVSRHSSHSVCPQLIETADCATDPCPSVHCQVTTFSAWEPCPVTCGGATHKRTRSVVRQDEYGGRACPPLVDSRRCGTDLCPVHCKMSTFSAFTRCSRSCGSNGVRRRSRRVVVHPMRNGRACAHKHETAACNAFPCPIDCVHTEYTSFGACDKTCGWGVRTRTLSIVTASAFGGKACPDTTHQKACKLKACPVHCSTAAFTMWSVCTRTCGGGGGTQSRSRAITTQPRFGGRGCPHQAETRRCGNFACPVDCEMTPWGSYDACSTSCGRGFYTRKRTIASREMWGGKQCPPAVQAHACNVNNPCPRHCSVSPWEGWSRCSVTCGAGVQSRKRVVVHAAQHGGYVCPALTEQRACTGRACPVDCVVGHWPFAWGACSKSCGWGVSHKTRPVLTAPRHGGRACPATRSSRTCNNGPCPIDCKASAFTVWGACSKTCGKAGKQERHRTLLVHPQHGGRECPKMIEVQDCYRGPCAVDCDVSQWSSWGPCSKSCGLGRQTRSRSIERQLDNGGSVCPALASMRGCNPQLCPVDCVLGAWGAWEAQQYAKQVGAVQLQRKRDRLIAPVAGGVPCGALTEVKTRKCANQDVLGSWSRCSASCGTGYQYRYREHVRCAAKAAVKYHLRFRQGQHCSVRACKPGELARADELAVPGIPAVASSAMMTLDEELAVWRTLSATEARAFGLPTGHWQKLGV